MPDAFENELIRAAKLQENDASLTYTRLMEWSSEPLKPETKDEFVVFVKSMGIYVTFGPKPKRKR